MDLTYPYVVVDVPAPARNSTRDSIKVTDTVLAVVTTFSFKIPHLRRAARSDPLSTLIEPLNCWSLVSLHWVPLNHFCVSPPPLHFIVVRRVPPTLYFVVFPYSLLSR